MIALVYQVIGIAYLTKLPFLVLSNPSRLTWSQLNEIFTLVNDGLLRLLKDDLRGPRVRATCSEGCGTQ